MTKVVYHGFWPGFDPDHHSIGIIFESLNKKLEILGPFEKRRLYLWAHKLKLGNLLHRVSGKIGKKADFYVTCENKAPEFGRAKKQIGFWRNYQNRDDVFRFPNWMWTLDWPDMPGLPPYPRYGMRLSIDRLMRPIYESYDRDQLESRIQRAVLFSKHLKEPRQRLFNLTKHSIGCDGFGGAFQSNNRKLPKMPLMEKYCYSLCPENSIGDGYITEKIPEAFHSGCIPITWAKPEDLEVDFNPKAVVNLYGLNNQQSVNILLELKSKGEYFRSLLNEPLLLKRPSLAPLIQFINE